MDFYINLIYSSVAILFDNLTLSIVKEFSSFVCLSTFLEALESVMCDVIRIRLKRRIATRSGNGNLPVNIKTAIERPILKLGYPNFR